MASSLTAWPLQVARPLDTFLVEPGNPLFQAVRRQFCLVGGYYLTVAAQHTGDREMRIFGPAGRDGLYH